MRRFIGAIVALVLSSAIIGVLGAGIILPVVGVAGVSARAASDAFLDLPAELPEVQLPQRSTILAADGSLLATVFLENRKPVPLDQVAPIMQEALLAIEDSRFYSHSGVDPRGLGRAIFNNARGGDQQGASTLTQQYVKNALLVAAHTDEAKEEAVESSVSRKLREARFALDLEQRWTKDQIFEGYLNIAYFGDGAYGIEAAAQHYFGKPALDLNLNEGALLAGLVQSPSRFDPTSAPDLALARRNVVLGRMLAVGTIDQATYDVAVAEPIVLNVVEAPSGCEVSVAPFFCDYVRLALLADPAMGDTREERVSRLMEGGLTIKTSLDLTIQAASQNSVDTVLGRDHRVASAVVMVEPGTGLVKSMAVNRNFGKGEGQTEIPLAVNQSYQPGSTFKMFTLVAALEQGIPPSTVLAGGECYTSQIFNNPGSGCFRNSADGEGGAMDMASATALSVNTWFVQLEERTGVLSIADVAKRMGITSLPLEGDNRITEKDGSFTLGTREVSPLEMAVSYATIAAQGMKCDALPVVEVVDSKGSVVKPYSPKCEQVITPEVANTVSSMLEGVITNGTAEDAAIGRPVAGKTGTTQSWSAAWFTGFTPDLATAVWVGDPRGGYQYPLTNVSTPIGYYSRVYGGTIPVEIFRRAMVDAHVNIPVRALPVRSAVIAAPPSDRVPSVVGLPQTQAEAILVESGYTVAVTLVENPLIAPGTIVAQTPEAGTGQTDGEISLQVSSTPATG